MKIALDYDDFSPLNHRFDLLDKLRERYEGFKVTMFTIPWDIRFNPDGKGTPITDRLYAPWVDRVKEAVEQGWMEIALHGLDHAPQEFENLTYQQAKNRVIVGEKMFANVGIPVIKLFKAPQWLLSDSGKKAIEDLGYTVCEDGYYNWNLRDELASWHDEIQAGGDRKNKAVVAHGHVQDEPSTMNGMDQTLLNLSDVPQDAEWVFLRETL